MPRRYGTGVPALAKLAQARAAGWSAVARVLAPIDELWMAWVMDASVEDFERALGWRQGEEELFGADLLALNTWRTARTRRMDADLQRERVAGALQRHPFADAFAAQAESFAVDCAREAESWARGDVAAAREARAGQAAALEAAPTQMGGAAAESRGGPGTGSRTPGTESDAPGAAVPAHPGTATSAHPGTAASAHPGAAVPAHPGAAAPDEAAHEAVEPEPAVVGMLRALEHLPSDLTPVRYLRRLSTLFVELETGGNTLKHLR